MFVIPFMTRLGITDSWGGQSWVFTSGNWSPQDQGLPQDQVLAPPHQEPEEHQVPPEAQPPAHLWNAPGYVVLSDDED